MGSPRRGGTWGDLGMTQPPSVQRGRRVLDLGQELQTEDPADTGLMPSKEDGPGGTAPPRAGASWASQTVS